MATLIKRERPIPIQFRIGSSFLHVKHKSIFYFPVQSVVHNLFALHKRNPVLHKIQIFISPISAQQSQSQSNFEEDSVITLSSPC